MNVPFLVSNILSGVGMCAMLASTALRSRRKILAVQSVNHALSMAACSLLRGWSGAVQEAVEKHDFLSGILMAAVTCSSAN